MKTAVEQFNALNGQVATRKELEEIAELGKMQGQINITNRIEKILNAFEHDDFEINLAKREMDRVPKDCLPGMECVEPDEEFEGLEKAVSPDDIYQMITDKMLDKLKEASGKGYKKKWKTQNEEGYLIPFNFDSKKPYRGINMVLLTNGMSQVLKNPYFLTFKQIQKNKGELKKGSKGSKVIYFTMLYSVSETNKNGENIEFGTYNKKKYLAWLKKNIHRLKYSLDYYEKSYIPILKYYNVFNGHDVEGIDFDLENFKIGYQNGSETIKNNDSRVEIADLIIANYPKPQPLLKDSKKGKAQYMFNSFGLVDEIHMPKFEDFETGLDYYRTLFHEFTHSTGSVRRLKRTMGGNFGSKPYAKEELIAEFGAVFLSAHAGIMWYNQSNHAEYLKNWNNALTHIKDDNRFIMRAASKAQEAADFILNYDKEGVPAYQNSLKSELKKDKKEKEKQNKVQKPAKKKSKPNTNDLLDEAKKAKITAKNKREFEKGLKKIGFEIVEYNSDQTSPKEWERNYKLDYKDIFGLELDMKVQPEGKEIEGDYTFNAIGENAESSIYYESLPELYESILEDFKETFNFSINEIEPLRKKYSKTLFGKKESKTQLGLFGSYPNNPNRKDTIDFAKKHLIGKSFFVDALNEKVSFKLPKIKHAINPPSKENLALVYKLPDMLSKAVLLTQQPDKKKRKEIKKVFKLVLIENLFGKAVRVLITIRKQDKNFYYDHAVIDTIKPEKQHGSVNKVNPIPLDVASPVPHKDKKKTNNKKNGLKAPVKPVATVPQPEPQKPVVQEPKKTQTPRPEPANGSRAKSLENAMQESGNNEVFKIPGDMGRFLGQVEKKPVHSVVTTLDAEQGSGKTRFFFQVMDVLAGMGLKCLFYSLEEHPASKLFKDKVAQYIKPANLGNISVIDEVEDWTQEKEFIAAHDIVIIDSFQKLPEIDLDKDIRKAFNGKWFFVIYQQTGTKSMRGGSKAAFDGDQILKVNKDPEDYRNNYVYPNKNRYNATPEMKFNIYTGKLVGESKVPEPQPKPAQNNKDPKVDTGNFIFSPIV